MMDKRIDRQADKIVTIAFILKENALKIQFEFIKQGRPTQVGVWAADLLFSHILGRNLSKT
jgi:hypothetical protein